MDALDICPTEDAIQEFLEYLVDPLLPLKYSASCEPLPSLQQSVAKQVHGVVLLYNYYHRKQNPQLKFLGLESFCKLAVVLKPPLLAHMKLFKGSDDVMLDDQKTQLSVLEGMVMNACNLSDTLDASRDSPSMEEWPISKVSVLLIDTQKEKCLLKFGSVTQGVWSVLEMDFDASTHSSGGPTNGKQGCKRKRISRKPLKDDLSPDEPILEQLAFSAVKEAVGIDEADLKVLERHLVYSHSKEKAVTRFYIMQCTKLTDKEVLQIPIKETIESLQGPLLKKSSHRWMISPVVEYFHILPYAGILSDWLSRELFSNNLHDVMGGMLIDNKDTTVRKGNSGEAEHKKSINESHSNQDLVEVINKKTESNSNESTELKSKDACHAINLQSSLHSHQHMDLNEILHLEKDEKDEIVSKIDQVDNHHKAKTPRTNEDPIGSSGFDFQDKGEELMASQCNYEAGDGVIAMVNETCGNVSADIDIMPTSERTLVVYHSNSNDESRDETVSAEKKACSDFSADNNKPSTNDITVVTYLPNSIDLGKLLSTMASKDKNLTEAALRALLRKKEKLSMQLRCMEDEIALCDSKIQTILKGGKDDLALKVESIIEGCNDVCLNCSSQENTYRCLDAQPLPQYHMKKRLSEAVLSPQDPCQELDAICYANNWILPTYHVMTSDGSFQASVTLKEVDFECSALGDLKSTPREGRGSAASKLLAKLRSMASASQ